MKQQTYTLTISARGVKGPQEDVNSIDFDGLKLAYGDLGNALDIFGQFVDQDAWRPGIVQLWAGNTEIGHYNPEEVN